MKSSSLQLAILLAIPVHVFAGEPVNIDVYLDGELQQTVSLVGANSTAKLISTKAPDATLEFRLIAPEPLILDVKEAITGNGTADAVGRVVLHKDGSSFALSDIKNGKFRNAYVLVRHD